MHAVVVAKWSAAHKQCTTGYKLNLQFRLTNLFSIFNFVDRFFLADVFVYLFAYSPANSVNMRSRRLRTNKFGNIAAHRKQTT